MFPPLAAAASLNTFAAAAISDLRLLVHDTRYALSILIFCGSSSCSRGPALTEFGPETKGESVERSSDMCLAYTAFLSAVTGFSKSSSRISWLILVAPGEADDVGTASPYMANSVAFARSQPFRTESRGKTPL